MITTKGVENNSGNEKRVSKFISPGIGEYKISGIVGVTSNSKGTPGIKLLFESRPLEALDGEPQTAEADLWLSEGAKPYTLSRLTDIANAYGVKEQLDSIEAPTHDAYAEAIYPIIGNKFARYKFTGEEIEGEKGNWFKAVLPLRYFVESLDVTEESSRLKFDPSNEYDMVKLPSPDMDEMIENSTENASTNDLPF